MKRILKGVRRRLRRIWPISFGSFSGLEPISRHFGFDRGLPIDRYYIEKFLQKHTNDIRGRALEIGDASYCRQCGGERITRQDVLHIHKDAPQATIVGDLSQSGILPADSFDVAVITQTLHLIYDMKAALVELRRGLKPGGVLLATFPGITPIAHDEWGKIWYWALTPLAATRLFGEVFGADNIVVEHYGNVFSATGFLQGVAADEVSHRKLDAVDSHYPVVIGVRAVRAD